MKYVVLSFDDGRKDFYRNAFPILSKYQIPATLNIITGFVGKSKLDGLASGNGECLSWEEIIECKNNGVEIASHSNNHSNEIDEITKAAGIISERLGIENLGFSSPHCEICVENFNKYKPLLSSNTYEYIRSGNKFKKSGLNHIVFYIINRLCRATKSKNLFYLCNRQNYINLNTKKPLYYPSTTYNNNFTANQVMYLIDKMPEDNAIIIMLHSILKDNDPCRNADQWFNSCYEFDKICNFIAGDKNIKALTNIELNNMFNGE